MQYGNTLNIYTIYIIYRILQTNYTMHPKVKQYTHSKLIFNYQYNIMNMLFISYLLQFNYFVINLSRF